MTGNIGSDPSFEIKTFFNGQKEVKNGVVKAIRSIHNQLNISSPINGDGELEYINIIYTARNCFVHEEGKVNSAKAKTLNRVSEWQSLQPGDPVILGKNILDDFVHGILMPTKGMILELDSQNLTI